MLETFDRVKVVHLLITDIKETEGILHEAEAQLADETDHNDISKLKEQQKVFQVCSPMLIPLLL